MNDLIERLNAASQSCTGDPLGDLLREAALAIMRLQQRPAALVAPGAAGSEAAGDVPVIDLEYQSWKAIKCAAASSPWMPAEYWQNDWVSDVVSFLAEPREEPAACAEPSCG